VNIVTSIANTDRRTAVCGVRTTRCQSIPLQQEHLNNINNNNHMGNAWCAPHFDTPYFEKLVSTVTRFVGPKIMQLSNTFCKVILYSSAGTLWHCTSYCGGRQCDENCLIRKIYRRWPRFPIRLTDHWRKIYQGHCWSPARGYTVYWTALWTAVVVTAITL